MEFRLPDFEHAMDLPAWLIRVRGGNLQLLRCKLIGPEIWAPPHYKGLISFHGSGDVNPDKANQCQIAESLLLSSQVGIQFSSIGQRVSLRRTAIAAGTSALAVDMGAEFKGQANIQLSMERTTLAARRACVELKETAFTDMTVDPVLLQTTECAFLTPFTGARAGLLLARGQSLIRGQFLWQGVSDALDPRMHFLMANDKAIPETQQKPGELVTRVWPVWRYPVKEARPPIVNNPLTLVFEEKKPWLLDRLVLPGPKTSGFAQKIDKRAGADMLLLGYQPPKRP